jgi:hypothetical protein
MGPLPAMFFPMFQIVDYEVHGWDIREGMRKRMNGGTARGDEELAGKFRDLFFPI